MSGEKPRKYKPDCPVDISLCSLEALAEILGEGIGDITVNAPVQVPYCDEGGATIGWLIITPQSDGTTATSFLLTDLTTATAPPDGSVPCPMGGGQQPPPQTNNQFCVMYC